jgi:hypothetical protein
MKSFFPDTLLFALVFALALTGCGTESAPLPPSLKLPEPIVNLAADRTGNQVVLTWTMPRRNTDKMLLKSKIPVRICRRERASACQPVPTTISFAPNAKAQFTDVLPPELASGTARPLTYFVEMSNAHGRSAGPSNAAPVLAGEAPGPVAALSFQLRKEGVVLHWTPDGSPAQSTVIRLHRTLLTPPGAEQNAKPAAQHGLLTPPKELVEQTLLADSGPSQDRVLDKTIRFGAIYEYRAQRVAQVEVDGKIVELASPLSAPIRVEAVDTFPPATPSGLAAVATAADSSVGLSIDLSWLPIGEADLAGYAVYRHQGSADPWQRISPPEPVIGPAFHDPHVEPGHTYHYAVTAIDQLGHESTRSPEAEETVPNP